MSRPPRRFPWSRLLSWLVPVAVVLYALRFPYTVERPRFWLPNIGIRTMWLGIIAMSLVFLNRFVGLLSLAQMTVAGVAAYGVGYATVTQGHSFPYAAAFGLGAGTLASFLIALIAVRTKAIYFLMITLALSQVGYSYASQAIGVTNARRGLAPVPRPNLGVVDTAVLQNFYYVCLAAAVLCYLLCRFVGATTFGLTLQGVRDSPDRMSALGHDVNRYRVAAMTFAGFIASVGGVLLVLDRSQVDPDVVSIGSTLDILVVAVIGGIGSLGGVFAGGLVLTLLDNFAGDYTDRYLTLTGLVFIAVLLFAPAGVAGVGKQVLRSAERLIRKKPSTTGSPQRDPATSPAAGTTMEGARQ